MIDYNSIYKCAKNFHKIATEGEFWLDEEGARPAPLKEVEPFNYLKDKDSKEVLHTVGEEGDLLIIDDTIFVWKLDNETVDKITNYAKSNPDADKLVVEETSTGKTINVSDLGEEEVVSEELATIASLVDKFSKYAQTTSSQLADYQDVIGPFVGIKISGWNKQIIETSPIIQDINNLAVDDFSGDVIFTGAAVKFKTNDPKMTQLLNKKYAPAASAALQKAIKAGKLSPAVPEVIWTKWYSFV